MGRAERGGGHGRDRDAGAVDEAVRLDVPADGVVEVRMQDADGRNALSPRLTAALLGVIEAAGGHPDTRVVVLSGGSDHFSTGATREVLEDLADGRTRPSELGLASRLLELEVPVIAACAGAAVGGGFVLATACDFLVLATDRRYGFNFMDLGITPGMGATSLAEHALGAAVAHELLYGGEFRSGADLAACPGVHRAVPSDEVGTAAVDLALRIADKPRENLVALKKVLTLPRRRRLVDALTLEQLMHATSLDHLDLGGMADGVADAAPAEGDA